MARSPPCQQRQCKQEGKGDQKLASLEADEPRDKNAGGESQQRREQRVFHGVIS